MRDFVAAWDKVMNLDRFDLASSERGAHNGHLSLGLSRLGSWASESSREVAFSC